MFAERLICSWIGALGLATGAFCQTYVQFSLGTDMFPGNLNEKGEITGYYIDAGREHGFVRHPDGTITTFDVPGVPNTQAYSINDEGAITGSFFDPTPPPAGRVRAYVRDPEGNFTIFDLPGSIHTMPQSINAGGAVTGYYYEANFVKHGFVRRADGKLISFDFPGSSSTGGTSINAKGAITGAYHQ